MSKPMKRGLPIIRSRYAILVDVVCILLAFAASVFIRFESAATSWSYMEEARSLLWLSLVIRLPVYAAFGLYQHLWRYASIRELAGALWASIGSVLIIWIANFHILPPLGVSYCTSHSIVVLDALLNLAFLSGSRLALRIVYEQTNRRQRRQPSGYASVSEPRRVIIAGAGEAGAKLVREMQQNPDIGLDPVAFVDDDRVKVGRHLHGVPVAGTCNEIPELAKACGVDEVIIAMPSVSGAAIRGFRRICVDAGLTFRIFPGIQDLLDGSLSVKQLREVRIEDLLRRDPVVTDQAGVKAYIEGTCVLVTGAGGSIGSELCRQLAQHEPSLLALLGHGEFSIFNIERELRQHFPRVPIAPVIADVRDAHRIKGIIDEYRPASIFHAAAHKHVPLMESNVEEAFTNNVLGTRCVLDAAEECGVERFVLISTDKAVNPSSVMGATKRVAELLVQDAAYRSGRRYVAVRFGNVLGSRGSAVPIFQEQIASGGPVTITHPEMHRYFMTIPEAVQLVLQAAALGKGGEVFMLDMGDPVRILDLVRDLIELSGLVPGEDIEVVFTGVRPGEKLCEELILDTEHYSATAHGKIFLTRNGIAPQTGADLRRQTDAMALMARQREVEWLLAGLSELVPEFARMRAQPEAGADDPAPASRLGRDN